VATQGKIQTEARRKRLAEKYSSKREELRERLAQLYHKILIGEEDEAVFVEVEELQQKLDSMPRNSSLKRRRNRCRITGRPRGYYRKFGLCRNMIRQLAMMGLIPGVVKSSW